LLLSPNANGFPILVCSCLALSEEINFAFQGREFLFSFSNDLIIQQNPKMIISALAMQPAAPPSLRRQLQASQVFNFDRRITRFLMMEDNENQRIDGRYLLRSMLFELDLVEHSAPLRPRHLSPLLEVEELGLRRLHQDSVPLLHQLLAADQDAGVLHAALLVALLALVDRLDLLPLVHHLREAGELERFRGSDWSGQLLDG
jgi:hypothetical protein